jgi:hypothetical protein
MDMGLSTMISQNRSIIILIFPTSTIFRTIGQLLKVISKMIKRQVNARFYSLMDKHFRDSATITLFKGTEDL